MQFEFNTEEAQIILNALVKEPYGLVVDIVNKMQDQASKQINSEAI